MHGMVGLMLSPHMRLLTDILSLFAVTGLLAAAIWFSDPYRKQPVLSGKGRIIKKSHSRSGVETSRTVVVVPGSTHAIPTVRTSERFTLLIDVQGVTDTIDVDESFFRSVEAGAYLQVNYRMHPRAHQVRIQQILFHY